MPSRRESLTVRALRAGSAAPAGRAAVSPPQDCPLGRWHALWQMHGDHLGKGGACRLADSHRR